MLRSILLLRLCHRPTETCLDPMAPAARTHLFLARKDP